MALAMLRIVELAGQGRSAAAAKAVAHHHHLLDLELGHGELESGRDPVMAAGGLVGRHQGGDVPDHEHLAGPGIENLGRVDPAVRAGDHHHAGVFPGELASARAPEPSRSRGSGDIRR